jgi:hypothetical protein
MFIGPFKNEIFCESRWFSFVSYAPMPIEKVCQGRTAGKASTAFAQRGINRSPIFLLRLIHWPGHRCGPVASPFVVIISPSKNLFLCEWWQFAYVSYTPMQIQKLCQRQSAGKASAAFA